MTKNYKYFLYGTDAIPEWFNKQYNGQYVITDEGFTFTADPLDTDDPYIQEIKKKEQNTNKTIDPIFEYFQVGVDNIPDWFQDHLILCAQKPDDSNNNKSMIIQEIQFTDLPLSKYVYEDTNLKFAYHKDYIVRNKETKYTTVFSDIEYNLLFGKEKEE